MKAAVVAELPLGGQHFFRIVCGCPRVYWMQKILASFFFEFFLKVPAGDNSEARDSNRSNVAARYRCAPKATIHVSQDGIEIRSRACLRAGTSRLKIQEVRATLFREQL